MARHLHLAGAPTDAGRPPEPGSPIRVILADDHRAMRRNLRMLLELEDGIEVITEAEDLDAVVQCVHRYRPHVLILDLRLSNGSVLATIHELRHQVPGTETVALTMEASPAFAKHALASGALGYVLKDHADSDLVNAVRSAADGNIWLTPQVEAGLRAMDRTVADRLAEG